MFALAPHVLLPSVPKSAPREKHVFDGKERGERTIWFGKVGDD